MSAYKHSSDIVGTGIKECQPINILYIIARYWFQILLIGSLVITSYGCSSSKNKTRKLTDTNTTRDIKEKETLTTTRKGDTITYTVLNPILKDTTIYVKNTEKTGSLRIKYDSSGKQTIDCISDEINELKETIRSISENETKKEDLKTKDKETIVDGKLVFYIFLGLGGLLVLNKVTSKFI